MRFERLIEPSQVSALIEFHNLHSYHVVIDVETTSVNPRQARLIDVQISGRTEDSAVIFRGEMAGLLLDLKPWCTLVAHNYKYDAHVLYRHGVDLLDHKWRDTLLMGHLIDENRESYSLDSYVKEYWQNDYKSVFWSKYGSYEEASEEDKINYSCRDIWYTRHLYRQICDSLALQGIPTTLIEHVHKLQAALLRTEIEGIRVDLDYLRELGVKLKQRIDALTPQMREMVKDETEVVELEAWHKEIGKRKTDKGKAAVARPEFSFESPSQLQRLLYGALALPEQRNAKTKAISTDYASLENIKEKHPVVGLIQENRELQKVYTAYVEGTLDRVDSQRIYPQFRIGGTVTGRIAHSNPNLAQLPKSGGVRGIYVPDRGRVLISADYSQLEVVIEANLTGDKNLIRMLENGESKHDLTARELGCNRDIAKTLNFALQYWASHFKVAKLLGVSNDEGLRIWRKYWEIYSGPKELKAKTDKMVDEGVPLETVFGRRRRFPVRKRQVWDADYRQAYNFMVQSTGADITSQAFYGVSDWLRYAGKGRALFSVHDEIIIEVDEDYADTADKRLKAIMTEFPMEKIPLKVESSGPMSRWED